MDTANATIAAALVTASVALVATAITLWQERSRRREEMLVDALGLIVGGTQKRSAGLSIAEILYCRRPLRPALTSHLINQLLYLQTVQSEPNAEKRRHEQDKVRRLADLLVAIGDFDRFPAAYTALCAAVKSKPLGLGVPIPPQSDVAEECS